METQLVRIGGASDNIPEKNVIFVHGLNGSLRESWSTDSPDGFWPEWLAKDYPQLGIWSVGYDASASRWKGTAMALYHRATNVLAKLDAQGLLDKSMCFVTHSMGGLLVKKMLSNAYDLAPEYKQFTRNTRGIVFLATPHSGSDLANWANFFGFFFRPTVAVQELKSAAPILLELNTWYRVNARQLGVRTQVYHETQSLRGPIVVDAASADPGIEGVTPIPTDANHSNIIKLASRESLVYTRVSKFVSRVLLEEGSILPPEKLPTAQVTETAKQPPTPTIKSLYELRGRGVPDFVGRQSQINRLVNAFFKASESGKAAIGGIRGLGGLGKTELAYVVAQRLEKTFPDAQILLEMRGIRENPMTAEQALQEVIQTFEPLAKLPEDLGALRTTYFSLLTEKRVLILADDVHDESQVEALLPPPGCALLLTTRQRFPLPGMETINLEILLQEEAEELLLKIYPEIGAAAPRLTQLCGKLPLALRLSANILANSPTSVEEYLNVLGDERTRLAHLRSTNRSVEASLQLSYAALDPAAQQVLCQMSVFPASFDTKAAKAVVEVPKSEGQGTTGEQQSLEEVLELLYQRSLLEWDRQTGRYSLHDLVRAFALARLEDEDVARMRHAVHYAEVAALADNQYLEGSGNVLLGLKLFDGERTHIDAGWSWAQRQAGGGSQGIDQLLLNYTNATYYVGNLRYDKRLERIPQLEVAIDAAQRLGDKRREGNAMGTLGVAYADLGETHKAIEYFEQWLQISREIGDRRGEGSAMGNLGLAYATLGEARKAIEYLEQDLKISREIGDRRGEGSAMGNLGLAYATLGETHKAIEYFEQVLQISREIGDRRAESSTLGNLGNAFGDLGETHKAIEYFKHLLKIAREMGDRHSEGKAMGNLGLAYAALGEARKAIEYLEQDLKISREIGDRQGEAITSWNLGMLFKESDPARRVELMQILVDYECEIGHADAEKHAAQVEALRKGLA